MSDYVRTPPADELIPLSVLSLDLEPSTAGWHADLAARGIAVRVDDVGRSAITREAARRLFVERAEGVERAREVAARADAEIEARRLAGVRPGIPAGMVPAGVTAAEFGVTGWRRLPTPPRTDPTMAATPPIL